MTVTEPAPAPARSPVPPLAARARSVGGSPVRDILAVTARPEVINFAGGLPAPELFDAEGIAAAYRAVLAEEPARALQYSTTEGEPTLRAALADRTTARGLPTAPDDLLVTTGSQQALVLATALLEPGDTVLVENPCYLAALQAFGLAGARIVAVPGDEHGVDPEALEDLVARERPKLLYTVPTFHTCWARPADRRGDVGAAAGRDEGEAGVLEGASAVEQRVRGPGGDRVGVLRVGERTGRPGPCADLRGVLLPVLRQDLLGVVVPGVRHLAGHQLPALRPVMPVPTSSTTGSSPVRRADSSAAQPPGEGLIVRVPQQRLAPGALVRRVDQ
ncbi:hypothetical protein SVIOM74S_04116 [Streptomyces violarus]